MEREGFGGLLGSGCRVLSVDRWSAGAVREGRPFVAAFVHPDDTEVNHRNIRDNSSQFIARDEFLRVTGMSHAGSFRYYPQSSGKIERSHKTLKGDALRVSSPSTLHYAARLLRNAIGYVTPHEFLASMKAVIGAKRDRSLEAARGIRTQRRRAAHWLSLAETRRCKPFRTLATTASARRWVPVVTPRKPESGSRWAITLLRYESFSLCRLLMSDIQRARFW